jgi:hypothetical protein
MLNSWRALLKAPALPFVLQHLQPYDAPSLEVLRQQQLVTLSLPGTGYGTAIDLGDPASPLGAVHFRNKQAGGERLAVAIRALWGDASVGATYPPPAFLTQATYFDSSNASTPGLAQYTAVVAFFRPPGLARGGTPTLPLTLAPPPPCPLGSNCTCFEILGSNGGVYAANATLTADSLGLMLTAVGPATEYPVGTAYAWSAWPLIALFGPGGMPVLPWSQNLIMAGPPGPPPRSPTTFIA